MNINKKKLLRILVNFLFVLFIGLTLLGLLLAASLKINRYSDLILQYYPKYNSALNGISILS